MGPATDSIGRRPRCKALVGGTLLPGVVSVEITHNNHFGCDTWRLGLALADLAPPFDVGAWSHLGAADVEILAGFADASGQVSSWSTQIYGQVDDVLVDWRAGQMHLKGRDLAARLIDAQSGEDFVNQTSSQIAATLAARHGLTAQVAPTTTRAGTYYEIDHAHVTNGGTEWDLLTWLAAREGYDVWVQGTTLFFLPRPDPATASPDLVYIVPWHPGLPLQASRALTLANTIEVTVKSWNGAAGQSIVRTVQMQPVLCDCPGKLQQYAFTVPGLTSAQALALAQSKAADIARAERGISLDLPGDPALTGHHLIRLRGSGTSWDQDYYADTVHKRWSEKEGFRMTIKGLNHSPRNMVVMT